MLIFLIGIGIIGIGTPRSFFLYKAIECHADFVIHCEGIALDRIVMGSGTWVWMPVSKR